MLSFCFPSVVAQQLTNDQTRLETNLGFFPCQTTEGVLKLLLMDDTKKQWLSTHENLAKAFEDFESLSDDAGVDIDRPKSSLPKEADSERVQLLKELKEKIDQL